MHKHRSICEAFARIRPEYALDTLSLRFQGRLAREGGQPVCLCNHKDVFTFLFYHSPGVKVTV